MADPEKRILKVNNKSILRCIILIYFKIRYLFCVFFKLLDRDFDTKNQVIPSPMVYVKIHDEDITVIDEDTATPDIFISESCAHQAIRSEPSASKPFAIWFVLLFVFFIFDLNKKKFLFLF